VGIYRLLQLFDGVFFVVNAMAVQISLPGFQPRIRLEAPSVYFQAQNVGSNSVSESFTAPPPASQRSQGPAVVPGIAPPSKSINTNAASGATGPLGSFDGRRMRSKSVSRRTVDYNASLINYVQVRQQPCCFSGISHKVYRK